MKTATITFTENTKQHTMCNHKNMILVQQTYCKLPGESMQPRCNCSLLHLKLDSQSLCVLTSAGGVYLKISAHTHTGPEDKSPRCSACATQGSRGACYREQDREKQPNRHRWLGMGARETPPAPPENSEQLDRGHRLMPWVCPTPPKNAREQGVRQ